MNQENIDMLTASNVPGKKGGYLHGKSKYYDSLDRG
jgi:hypothetical protein